MKRILLSLLALMVISSVVLSQNNIDYTKSPAIGIHFFFNDFKTASSIRSNSLGIVLRDKKYARIKEMTPGLAVNYLQGINNYLDFSGTLAASFLDYPFEGRNFSGNESMLLEGDASIHAKLFTDKYWVVPYFSAGLGISQFSSYYGAFIPVG